MVNYDLRGPDIEIKYHDGDLLIEGDDPLLPANHILREDENLSEAPDGIGSLITTELLASSRNGTRVTLSLILPDVGFTSDEATPEVTGVAIITRQFKDVIGSRPAVLQSYGVRTLTGSASLVAQTAADAP
ncbi:hypothetical protein [Streptomyces coeruleorubidus]|uniref:hypothetical protein n=1 Tax=Streptomyces coeruleorubidus TaxID=116188 RepID=UPI0033ABDC5B